MATASIAGIAGATTAATPLLDIKTPVPSDIDIAQSVTPQHIGTIATALGLTTDEFDLYGKHKAKARQACTSLRLLHLKSACFYSGEALRARQAADGSQWQVWYAASLLPNAAHRAACNSHVSWQLWSRVFHLPRSGRERVRRPWGCARRWAPT
jgi:hypothetical protein